jgi:hypothetical protein
LVPLRSGVCRVSDCLQQYGEEQPVAAKIRGLLDKMPGDFDRRFQPARYEVTERLFAQMAEAMRVGLVGPDSAP